MSDDTLACLLRGILDNPADDTPRLVYADRLDELGEYDRAEFIRVQCELARLPACLTPSAVVDRDGRPLPCRKSRPRGKRDCLPWCAVCERYSDLRRRERELFEGMAGTLGAGLPDGYVLSLDSADFPSALVSRGFIARVELPLAALVGGECRRCAEVEHNYPAELQAAVFASCTDCSGTGRTPGLAPTLFARHPITEVRATDKRPEEGPSGWSWFAVGFADDPATLPEAVFARLSDDGASPSMPGQRLTFQTLAEADAALSAAVVNWGRSVAEGVTHRGECGKCFRFGDRWVVENPNRRHKSSAIVMCPHCGGTGTAARPGLPPLPPFGPVGESAR